MEHSQSSATGHPRNINVQFYLRTLFLMLYSWKNIYYLNFWSHAKRHTKIFRCFNTSQMFDFLLNSTPIRTCRVKFILWLQYDYCSTSNEFCGFHQLVEDKYCLGLMQKTVKEIQQGHVYLFSYQVMVSERTLFIHEESISFVSFNSGNLWRKYREGRLSVQYSNRF